MLVVRGGGCGWVGGPGSNRSSPALQRAVRRALADLAGGEAARDGHPSPTRLSLPSCRDTYVPKARKPQTLGVALALAMHRTTAAEEHHTRAMPQGRVVPLQYLPLVVLDSGTTRRQTPGPSPSRPALRHPTLPPLPASVVSRCGCCLPLRLRLRLCWLLGLSLRSLRPPAVPGGGWLVARVDRCIGSSHSSCWPA